MCCGTGGTRCPAENRLRSVSSLLTVCNRGKVFEGSFQYLPCTIFAYKYLCYFKQGCFHISLWPEVSEEPALVQRFPVSLKGFQAFLLI